MRVAIAMTDGTTASSALLAARILNAAGGDWRADLLGPRPLVHPSDRRPVRVSGFLESARHADAVIVTDGGWPTVERARGRARLTVDPERQLVGAYGSGIRLLRDQGHRRFQTPLDEAWPGAQLAAWLLAGISGAHVARVALRRSAPLVDPFEFAEDVLRSVLPGLRRARAGAAI